MPAPAAKKRGRPGAAKKDQAPNGRMNMQENINPQGMNPSAYNTEKKSWEYQYNYEGMD